MVNLTSYYHYHSKYWMQILILKKIKLALSQTQPVFYRTKGVSVGVASKVPNIGSRNSEIAFHFVRIGVSEKHD